MIRTRPHIEYPHRQLLLALSYVTMAAQPVFSESLQAQLRDHAACRATEAAGLVTPAAEAQLTITYPREGDTIHVREFPLQLALEGDLAGARFDHIHWKLSEGANNTAADNSGVVDVVATRDGDHEFIVYMATPEHVVINQKVHLNFRIVTRGSVLLTPNDGSTVSSSDVTVYYGTYGDVPTDATMNFQVDSGAVTQDPDKDGEQLLSGISNGAHQLKIWLTDTDGSAVGDAETRNIIVNSPLSVENAQKALAKISRAAKTGDVAKRRSLLKSAKKILSTMSTGGTASPEDPQLTSTNVSAAMKQLKKIEKTPADDQKLIKLKKLLKSLAT